MHRPFFEATVTQDNTATQNNTARDFKQFIEALKIYVTLTV